MSRLLGLAGGITGTCGAFWCLLGAFLGGALAFEDGQRFVKYIPFPGAEPEYYELIGPVYGSTDVPLRWHKTFTDWITSAKMGYTQAKNDKCLYVHKKTNHNTSPINLQCPLNCSKMHTKMHTKTHFIWVLVALLQLHLDEGQNATKIPSGCFGCILVALCVATFWATC